jgi:hypothetical protein
LNSNRPISRQAWAFFLAGIAVCGTVVVAAQRFRPAAQGDQPELSRLLAERETLSAATDEVRRPLAEQWAAIRQRAWTAGQIAEMEQALTGRWRWEWEPGARPSRVQLHARAGEMDQWTDCLETVRLLGSKPGIVVETLEVRARGDAAHRTFTTMTIGVRFVRDEPASGDAERSAPSRSPLPVAAGNVPDPLRNVGSGPPLRSVPARPSGSASGFINQDPTKETTRP